MTLLDVLLPDDDRTVLIQLVAVVVIGGISLLVARRNRDAVFFIAGLMILLLGLIGVRAVH